MGKQSLWLIIVSLAIMVYAKSTEDYPGNIAVQALQGGTTISSTIQPPVLKWQHGGCYSSWCETGWYASPAYADLNEDGRVEVIAAAYSVFILDGETGALIRRIDPPGDRVWPSVVIADINQNGKLEVVTAHGNGYVNVFDHLGDLLWSRQPTPGNELRSLAVFDLDGDGYLEIIVASTRWDNQWHVYQHNGNLREGAWPQHYPDSNENGYAAGAFNQNVAAGDLTGDGFAEIVGPNDTHYIAAFRHNGTQLITNPIYAYPDGGLKYWSRVGVHVDHDVDLRGYAFCGVEHRPNFAHSAPIIIDVNQDGTNQVVVVGNVYNCGTSPYTSLYEVPFIFNGDRSRWADDDFSWEQLPLPDSLAAPLTEDYALIENNQPNPVAVDLDNDGVLEIIYPSYDGRMHAYWLDGSQHGNWPYSIYNPAEGIYRFASEPVVADLDNDGYAEVIFTTWAQKGTNQTGSLHILDYLGNAIHEVSLPPALNGNWNGALAAPTLANLDDHPDLEIILNTAHSGVVVYTLPGTADARIQWGTGRGSLQRSGSLIAGNLKPSAFHVQPVRVAPGDLLTYTIILRNSGALIDHVVVFNSLPAELVYSGQLSASSGQAQFDQGNITWAGSVGQPVIITYQARIIEGTASRSVIRNTIELTDGMGNVYIRDALSIVDAMVVSLPVVSQVR